MNSVGGNALHNNYYALVNFMPHPRGGDTGDLTNRGVKFPTTGEKSAVKSPTPIVGDLTTPQG